MIRRLGIALVFADDYSMMKAWYQEVLELMAVEVNDDGRWASFKASEGDALIAIHGGLPISRGSARDGVPPIALSLQTDSLEDSVSRLKAKGVKFHKEIRSIQGVMNAADVLDPEGNLIQLYERIEEQP